MIKRIGEILKQGEGLKIEFKESKNKINKDVYETVCSFLNRCGGEIILGVNDYGDVIGIDGEYIDKIKKDFVTSMNNSNKINPTYYLSIEEFNIEGKNILYIFIPESSQVHRCNNRIFDRNQDGDIDITDYTSQVAAMYQRKELTYFSNFKYSNSS